MNRRHLLLPLAVSALCATAGCGTGYNNIGAQSAASPTMTMRRPVRPADATPIFNLPGVQIGQTEKIVGQYKSINITGSGELTALDADHMAMNATVSGRVLFVTETKQVQMTVAKSTDANWPYTITAVNVTDKQNYNHQGKIASQSPDGLTTNFTLDDGTTSVIAADGKGDFKVSYGDFNLVIGNGNPSLLLAAPRPNNHPTHEKFFSF